MRSGAAAAAHDFARLPVFSPAPVAAQAQPRVSTPGDAPLLEVRKLDPRFDPRVWKPKG
jgi:hypothetical protein